MTSVRRLFAAGLVAVLAGGGLAACGKAEIEALKEVRAALRKTEKLSYRFVYRESALGSPDAEVRGILEDDLRYKTQLSLGGEPMMEEVVSDDTVADRFFSDAALKLYLNPEGGAGDDTGRRQGGAEAVGASTVEVRNALGAKQWVVDPAGAPSLPGASIDLRTLGQDPVQDSLTVFRYMDQVLRSNFVYEFNEDALDYRPDEDPFAKQTPEELFPGRDVTRYDVGRPPLPKASDTQAGNQITPGMEHFRYMAIYVEDGIVIRIDETIDLGLQLKDLRENYDLDLPDDPDEAIAISVKAINAVRLAQSDAPLRVRKMSYQLTAIGEKNEIALPSGDVITGSLSVLKNRGRAAAGQGLVAVPGSQASGGGGSGGGDATGGGSGTTGTGATGADGSGAPTEGADGTAEPGSDSPPAGASDATPAPSP